MLQAGGLKNPLLGANIVAWIKGSSIFSAMMISKLLASTNFATVSGASPWQASFASMGCCSKHRTVAPLLLPQGLLEARDGDLSTTMVSGVPGQAGGAVRHGGVGDWGSRAHWQGRGMAAGVVGRKTEKERAVDMAWIM